MPSYDRRATDRHISTLEGQIEDLREQVRILDRDGSRGHGVLLQRVIGNEQRSADLVAANERAHESIRKDLDGIRQAMRHIGAEIEDVRRIQTAANVPSLPARVDRVEDELERRQGLLAGVRTAVGVYIAVAVAAAGIVLQVALK